MEIYHPKDEELLREMKRVRRVLKRKRLLWGLLIFVVLGAVFGWFVFHRYCAIAVVRGDAMGDTLPDGSVVLVWREDGRDVERGDIILYETETGAQIKRVLALPGDQVVISPNTWIRINGDRVNEPYAIGRTRDAEIFTRRLTVEKGTLFVQGDHRTLSVDSRYRNTEEETVFPPVDTNKVVGTVKFVIWPAYRFGMIAEPGAEEAAAEVPEQEGGQ